jgi:GT2 family glycosyltransferase
VQAFTDSRIRLVRQDNEGVSAARNRGVTEANASLLAFLDSDDEWMPDFLTTVLELHSQFPVAKVWGTAYAMQDSLGRLTPVKSVRTDVPCLINFWACSGFVQPMNASSILVERNALEGVGGFHRTLIRLEDTEMLVRLALRHAIAYSPQVKAIYHMEADNRTDCYVYTGSYPFFEAARMYLRQGGKGAVLSKEAKDYLALMHTRALRPNWLAGNRAAMREIIGDCRHINRFRALCAWWWAASLIPHRAVLAGWAARSIVARCLGRQGKMQPVRSIYRPTTRNCRDHHPSR